MNFRFWFNFIYFIIACFVAFYIPGRVVLGDNKSFSKLTSLFLSFILGMVLWAWQGFIFGYLNLRNGTYIYLLLFLLLWWRKRRLFLSEYKFGWKDLDLATFLLIFVGMFFPLVMLWGSGLNYNDGIRIYQINMFDGVWHLALINQVVDHIPPYQPGMAGELVRNYHYWSNLVEGEMARIFRLPIINLHFQYFNFFLSLFLGLGAYVVAKAFGGTKIMARWWIFFLYLGGDVGYLLLMFLGRGFSFEVPSLDNGAFFLQNPPRAFSVIIILAGLAIFSYWVKSKDFRLGLILAVIFGSLVGFKIYTGMLALSGLAFVSFYYLLKKRWQMVLPFSIAVILSAVIFLPTNAGTSKIFWSPFEWPINFLTQGKVGLGELELRRRVFLEHHNIFRVVQIDIMATTIFLLTIFGTKMLGFFQTKDSLKEMGIEKTLLITGGIATSLFFGLFILQAPGNFNTFNFFISAGLFLSLLAAWGIGFWQSRLKNRFLMTVLTLSIIVITIPRVVYEVKVIINDYIENKDVHLFSNEELEGLRFLREKTPKDSLILVHPDNFIDSTAPYVSFFSNRAMFLSGRGILNSHGVGFAAREEIVKKIFNSSNKIDVIGELRKNSIDYLYLLKNQSLKINTFNTPLRKAFGNDAVTILQVGKI